MNAEQAYDWLAPKLSKDERQSLDVIQQRIAQLEADAARYQWLREQWFLDDGWLQSTECAFLESPEEFDESIDAAMKEQGK